MTVGGNRRNDTATPASEPMAEPASETQASVRATDDTFDPFVPQTWPKGIWAFLKSNAPSNADAAEAYQTWRQLQIEDERNALLRRIVEGKLSMPSATVAERDALAAPTSAPLDTQTESATMPVLIDAPEAAQLCGIPLKTFQQRKQRGQLPPGCIVQTGRRVQFHREKLLAGIAKRAR